jgi:hypothetical protein
MAGAWACFWLWAFLTVMLAFGLCVVQVVSADPCHCRCLLALSGTGILADPA